MKKILVLVLVLCTFMSGTAQALELEWVGPETSFLDSLNRDVTDDVEHLKGIAFSYSDIPTCLSVEWVERISAILQTIIMSNDKEIGIETIIKTISNEGAFLDDYIIKRFEAKIQVDYIPEKDDIQNFADYLMDLDESKHSFYFIYTFDYRC